MFYTYILKSIIKEWYYIGHTKNIKARIIEHNTGRVKSTKTYRPFILVYIEEFNSKREAFKREMLIKKYKHGDAFKRLIRV